MKDGNIGSIRIPRHFVTLKEHLGKGGGPSQITIDLKGRMVVEKVGKSRFR